MSRSTRQIRGWVGRTATTLFVAVGVIAAAAGTASAAPPGGGRPDPAQGAPGRGPASHPQHPEDPPPEARSIPPQPGGDPASFAGRAANLSAAFDAAAERADAEQRASLAAARAEFDAAAAEWRNGETKLVAVVRHLRGAWAALHADPTGAGGDEAIERGLSDLATLVTRGIIDVAGDAGADERTLAAFEAKMQAAADAFDSGDDGTGYDLFVDVMNESVPKLVFSGSKFAEKIKEIFSEWTVGFAYSIEQPNGPTLGGGVGWARRPADGHEATQSPTREMNIASISKTITAAAMLQALLDGGVGIDEAIAPYLPPRWERGLFIDDSGILSVTFRKLLTHTSGLTSDLNGFLKGSDIPSVNYAGVKKIVGWGVSGNYAGSGKYKVRYENVNFALMRFLIPRVVDPEGWEEIYEQAEAADPDDTNAKDDGIIQAAANQQYLAYVRNTVFAGAGVDGYCNYSTPGQWATHAYASGDVLNFWPTGYDMGNWWDLCGSGGWYLSADEVARVYESLSPTATNPVLYKLSRYAMRNEFFGFMDPANYTWGNGKFGTYHNHGGDLFRPNPDGMSPAAPMRGIDTCAMSFPNDVHAAILINSQGTSYTSDQLYQCAALQKAFDDAWVWT